MSSGHEDEHGDEGKDENEDEDEHEDEDGDENEDEPGMVAGLTAGLLDVYVHNPNCLLKTKPAQMPHPGSRKLSPLFVSFEVARRLGSLTIKCPTLG